MTRRNPLRVVPLSDTSAYADPIDEERLVDALRARRHWADRAVLESYTPHVRRLLVRILGSDAEVEDMTQEVFLRGLERIGNLRDGVTLRSWFAGFAVFVAREWLRKRARRRWLLFFAPHDLPEMATPDGNEDAASEAGAAMRATYEVLGKMSFEARTAFSLRHIDGMELAEVAGSCGVSLATIKRRLQKAEKTFADHAHRHPLLRRRIEAGTRW